MLESSRIWFGHNMQERARSHPGWQDMHRLNVCPRAEFLRFLGSVRPVRLLDKFRPDKLGLLGVGRTVRLVEVRSSLVSRK